MTNQMRVMGHAKRWLSDSPTAQQAEVATIYQEGTRNRQWDGCHHTCKRSACATL